MGRFYKLFKTPRTVFCVISCILVTAFSCQANAATSDSVFTVQGVNVDITADDAADAREQAFAKAQAIAFGQLVERLLSSEQLAYFEMPESSVISALVKDFEITQEKLSQVRYIGTYTFRFKNDAVRNYLGAKGFAYTDLGSKPVLVLPFYQHGPETVLWGEQNPWLQAWSNTHTFEGLVPVVIPIGDLQDVSAIGDNQVLDYDPAKLAAMAERYNAGEAIIMLATPQWSRRSQARDRTSPDRLIITVYRTDRHRPEFANRLTLSRDELAEGENIFAAAVTRSRQNLQQAWKSRTLTNAMQGNVLKARVRFESMKEWIETQQKLRKVQGVNGMRLLSLTQDEATIELQFQGDEERLRLALAQADMTLSAPRGWPRYNSYNHSAYGHYDQRASYTPVYDLFLNKYSQPY